MLKLSTAILASLGWSQHLEKDSGWVLTKGAHVEKTRKALNFVYDSGVMLTIAFGCAFKPF